MKRRLVFFGLVALPALALFVVTLTLVMVFALQDDVGALEKRARAVARTERSLRADVEAIRDDLAALRADPASANPPSPVADAAPSTSETPARVVPARALPSIDSARVVKVNAVAPPECVFKPGDPGALTDCIRSQQENIGRSPAQRRYR